VASGDLVGNDAKPLSDHPAHESGGEEAVLLHHLMRGVKQWAEIHMDQVLANRDAYDTRVA
jgi:hypothetical protein